MECFAINPADAQKSWQKLNQAIAADGSVGIWHETYLIEPGRYKAIYGNMPVFGLAAATKHVPAMGQKETARRPLGGDGVLFPSNTAS